MEANVLVFHFKEARTMAFWGNVTPEQWNIILNPLDDMSRIVVGRVIGEWIFNYMYTWRTNNNIIGSFIGWLARAKVDHDQIIQLCCDLFQPTPPKMA